MLKNLSIENCILYFVFLTADDPQVLAFFRDSFCLHPAGKLVPSPFSHFSLDSSVHLHTSWNHVILLMNYILPVQIWTTDSKLKIKEVFESMFPNWTSIGHFEFIKFNPSPVLFTNKPNIKLTCSQHQAHSLVL